MLEWVLDCERFGTLPVAGGGLDQTQSFLDARRFIDGELRHWRSKLGIKQQG